MFTLGCPNCPCPTWDLLSAHTYDLVEHGEGHENSCFELSQAVAVFAQHTTPSILCLRLPLDPNRLCRSIPIIATKQVSLLPAPPVSCKTECQNASIFPLRFLLLLHSVRWTESASIWMAVQKKHKNIQQLVFAGRHRPIFNSLWPYMQKMVLFVNRLLKVQIPSFPAVSTLKTSWTTSNSIIGAISCH